MKNKGPLLNWACCLGCLLGAGSLLLSAAETTTNVAEPKPVTTTTSTTAKVELPLKTSNTVSSASTSAAPAAASSNVRNDSSRRERRAESRRGDSTSSQTNSSGSTNRLSIFEYTVFRDAFTKNNIFDPDRFPKRPAGEIRPQPRVERFALVGVMSYDKGQFAFFNGSTSQYSKALKPGEAIAGYTVTEVLTNKIKLKKDEKEIDFAVGMQMQREEEGEWKPSQRMESASTTSSTTTTNSDGSASPPPTAEPGSALERLLLKRRAEEAGKQ